ncbi:MAG: ABC transporter ATP-binding protein [Eubacteriales bacterium]|nr:ABC transporter ATP-binding protein [Eubacteriales bacterium]
MLRVFHRLRFILGKYNESMPGALGAYFFYHLFYLVLAAASSILGVILPARIVAVVANQGSLYQLLAVAGLLAVVDILVTYYSNASYFADMVMRAMQFPVASTHLMHLPAEKMEGSYGQRVTGSVLSALYRGNDVGVEAYIRGAWELIEELLISGILLLISARLSFWWMLLLIVTSLLKEWAKKPYHKYLEESDGEFVESFYEKRYFEQMAFSNEAAKDLRIYHLIDLFRLGHWRNIKREMTLYLKLYRKDLFYGLTGVFVFLFRDCLSILILIRSLKNGLPVTEFILYLSILPVVGKTLAGVLFALMQMKGNRKSVDAYIQVYSEPHYDSGNYSARLPEGTAGIRFEHVRFAYPTKDDQDAKPVFEDLSFEIKPGEKLALVGANGAGKTTIAKLACGLLTPESGEIQIGGVNIHDVNPKERYEYCTLVFQDIFIMAMTIAENVAGKESESCDRERVRWALHEAGLAEFVEGLPEGIDTMLTTYVEETGLELSGGQKQKLLLARALYKGGELLILDEPSSALDPLAEAALYRHYLDFSQEKTTIFISHRLSSTQFCDRIFYIEDGKIAEVGDHQSLMAKQGGYYEMFETQAKYYREEAENEEK